MSGLTGEFGTPYHSAWFLKVPVKRDSPVNINSMIRSVGAVAIVIVASVGCEALMLKGSPGDRGKPLSGNEIKAALVGNSIVGETRMGPLTIYFPSYGEMRGLRSFHYRDDGTWRVTEDSFCGEWNNWLGTMARCWRVYRSGDTVSLEHVDSSQQETVKLVRGNPANVQPRIRI